MRIFLVRHAHAIKRSEWSEADELRPLDVRGERQASGIAELIRKVPLRRVCSSPALRCRQTVDRVAVAHSLSLEVDPRLAAVEDADHAECETDASGALELLEERGGGPILLCASRSLIVAILRDLGVGRDEPRSLRCKKGSVWVLDRRGGKIVRAEYVAPREYDRGERRAVLDIGSTSLSLLVADVGPDKGRIQPVHRSRAELRLGASVGQIRAVDRDRVVKLCRSMQAEAESAGSAELISVATASLRNAANGAAVAESLDEVLKKPLRVLSGPEEAGIVYQAVRVRLGLDDQPTVVIDLGGGSLDLAFGRGEEVIYSATEPLGVTRLHSEYVRNDPMTKSEVKAIRGRVAEGLASHVEQFTGPRALRCAAAGGSIRALAKLVLIERGKRKLAGIRGIRILRSELESLAGKLRRAGHDERIAMPGIKSQRADLLPTGALVLAEVLVQLDLPELLVSDWGLREGVLIRADRVQTTA